MPGAARHAPTRPHHGTPHLYFDCTRRAANEQPSLLDLRAAGRWLRFERAVLRGRLFTSRRGMHRLPSTASPPCVGSPAPLPCRHCLGMGRRHIKAQHWPAWRDVPRLPLRMSRVPASGEERGGARAALHRISEDAPPGLRRGRTMTDGLSSASALLSSPMTCARRCVVFVSAAVVVFVACGCYAACLS